MRTSENDLARGLTLVVLLVANALLYMTWPWLRSQPLTSDSSATYSRNNVMRNELYLRWFFDSIHSDKRILYLGTSESTSRANLAAQFNQLAPDNPKIISYAKAGLSPIHSAVLVAKWEREGLTIPPLVLVINPVYFTHAYDEINDGWLSDVVRSPAFLQMNHRHILDYLSPEVRNIYDRHFSLRRLLYLATIQEYLGNLFYLFFHQVSAGPGALQFPVSTYEFTGKLPEYDEKKNVWRNIQAPDRFDKSRWLVSDPEESVNLKGLASSMRTLRTKSSPILLLVLPVNRKFYEYYGLDMSEFDNKYKAIRNTIKELAKGSNIYLIDLLESPKLRQGFEDRMHMDQYGNFQIARFILESPEYGRFLDGVRTYYHDPAIAHSVEPASQKSISAP
jgi:hypothetical protein